jgi:acyl carrier protein
VRSDYVAFRNETERAVAEIWQALFGIEQVGIHDNFFELGGDSLLATHVTARVRQAFGVEVPLRALFDVPTVAGLAERVEAIRWSAAGPRSLAAVEGNQEEIEL